LVGVCGIETDPFEGLIEVSAKADATSRGCSYQKDLIYSFSCCPIMMEVMVNQHPKKKASPVRIFNQLEDALRFFGLLFFFMRRRSHSLFGHLWHLWKDVKESKDTKDTKT
jgi:hypothetical protein